MSSQYIFVYGSLRSEFAADVSRLLTNHSTFFSKATFQGCLYEVNAYPGVIESGKPQDRVTGELYKIVSPEKLFPELDKYERCVPDYPEPFLYTREQLPVQLADGKTMLAWVYLYNRPVDSLEKIESGDYLKYCAGLSKTTY